MKKLYCLRGFLFSAVIVFTVCIGSYAQTSIDTLWTRTFPGQFSDVGRQVKQTADGGYIITGESESFGPGIWSVYIIKTDSTGEIEWNKTYGGAAFDFPYGIIQTSDYGYIASTYTTSFEPAGTNLRLIKLSPSGDTVWTSLLPNTNQHLLNSAGCIIQTNDGGYLLTAYGWKPPKANQIVLIKTDSIGIPEWSKEFGGSIDDFGGTVQQTLDGNYIISGYTYSYGNGACDGYIIKVNPTGDTLWTRYYGGSSFDSFRYIITTSDGGYLAVGTTQSYGNGEQAWVVKIDSLGTEEWSHAIGGSQNEAFEGASESVNGDYFLSGSTNSIGSGEHDAFFVRLSETGDLIQERAFGTGGEEFGATIERTADNGFIATGTYDGAFLDIWLIKFSADSIISGLQDQQLNNFPDCFILYQNYPNPFNPATNIKFSLDKGGMVKLAIFNILGEQVQVLVNQMLTAGTYSYSFDAGDLKSGTYFYRLITSSNSAVKKMIYLK